MTLRLKIPILRKMKISQIVLFWLWWYMLITPIFVYWLKLPKFILYIGDILGCGVFCLVLRDLLNKNHKVYVNKFSELMLIIFLISGSISAFANMINPIHYLWGIRNCGKYFLFFFAAAMYLDIDDFMKTRKIIRRIFWISVPLCFYQTYFVTYPAGTIIGDMVGGFYHGFNGVTMALNVILILETVDILNDYFQNKVKLFPTILTLLAAIFMSGWSELKIYIVELLIILAVLLFMSKKSIKTVVIVLLGVFAFSYIITFFTSVNARGQTTYGDIFTINGFLEYISRDSGYDGVGDLNRISGITTLNKGIFNGDIIQHVIGNGIGSAEYTNFFTTPFYNNNASSHYAWFHMIWVYIENGYVGVITLLFFMLSQLWDAFNTIKDKWLRNYCVAIIILTPVLFVYNITLRSEIVGLYMYFVMALPCMYKKKIVKERNK